MKRTFKTLFAVLMAFAMMMVYAPAKPAAAASFTEYYYGSNFYYKVYVPTSYKSGTATPMMVMLHGCLQNPDDFAAGTRMNALAEEKGFIVLYPEMNVYANPNMCWNWFYDYNQHRGAAGEADIIKGMVDKVKAAYTVDANKVYVAGISAGGSMASIMAATYPHVFRGLGVAAGVVYDAADTSAYALTVMSYGTGVPNTKGYAAYTEMGSYKRRMPVIVFHGSSDSTVKPVNGSEVVTSWANANDYIDDGYDNNSMNDTYDVKTTGTVSGGRSYTKYVYNDKNGAGLIEYYYVSGMGHAWSGGSSAGSYTDPYGPDASRIMWDFFVAH